MYDSYLIDVYSSEWYFVNIVSAISVIALLGVFYFILNSKYIKENELEQKITKTIGFFLLFRLLMYHSYASYTGVWDINHSLPFHLCGISSVLCVVVMLRYNQLIYEFLILLGAPGALWAFLTPEIHISEPWYMYFDYFVSHAAIIFIPLYLTICLNKRPRPLSYFKIFILMNVFVMPLVAIINIMIKSIYNSEIVNYMYLMRPTQAENPFIIGGWMYMVVMELTAFIHMFIIYSLFVIFYMFRNKINIKERLV